ncbi:MAG: CBM96 family carbohydrate-binding protein [Planctomycetota bacterium]
MKIRIVSICCFLILSVLIMNSTVLGTTITTGDASGADTYLYYYQGNTNYGSEPNLYLSKNYVPYVKFDLWGQNGEVIDANLVFYGTPEPANPPGYGYAVPIYGLLDGSDNWEELSITYNNAPLVNNPIVRHPLLVHLGWIDYTNGDESAIEMRHAGGTPLNSFLSNRGPDNKVTIIIGSDKYTAGNFFSTKEDGEAPYIAFDTVIEGNLYNWAGDFDDSWSSYLNWDKASVPDVNTTVHIIGYPANLPVVIDANAFAKKVFIHTGNADGCGLKVERGILIISDSVLRVKDGNTTDITDGEIRLAGNVEGHMWGLIGQGKIITSKSSVWEPYAEYDSDSGYTIVGARKLLRKLVWGNSIIDANGPLASGEGGHPAEYCVDGRDMLGEAHMGFNDKGAPIICNSYYGRNLEALREGGENYYEPTIKFEFDKAYNLTDMYIWNYELSYALKTVQVAYSVNDVYYTTLMNDGDPNFILDYGNKDGTKNDTISFGGQPAKYVKITAVGGPGAGNYETGFYGRYILREVQFCHEGMEASNPSPLNGKEVDIFLDLSWLPGNGAVTGQDIWLGKTGQPLVNIATVGPEEDRYQVDPLENLADYTWRVDGRDDMTITTGPEWTFSTRARLRWNPGIIGVVDANGSPGLGGTPGYRAVNESGLNYNLHDSFEWSNGWYCRKPWDLDPPLDEPQLNIEFDRIYEINEMWVWNHDGTTTAEAAMAMRHVDIYYSIDDVNYIHLTDVELPHGNTDGTHDTEVGFENVSAKYVRLIAGPPGVGNYGSTDWGYKLRELRFYYIVPLWADLNADKIVDIADLEILVNYWLDDNWATEPTPHCPRKPESDVDGDCKVNFKDFAILAMEWLEDIN